MEKSHKVYLPKITTFIFDVDGVLTNSQMLVDPNGELLRSVNVKDGFAIKLALSKGYKVGIISKGTNKAIEQRFIDFGLTEVYFGVQQKVPYLEDFIKKHKVSLEEIAYMGDDLADVPVLKKVGMSCAPQDAVREVLQVSNYISDKKGGETCVRDIIEQVMRVRGDWPRLEELV